METGKYCIIMAGGTGSRLWPLSRQSCPKQFIGLGSGKSMAARSVERLAELFGQDRCFAVTDVCLKELAQSSLAGVVPETHILLEPQRKSTCACITYAALMLAKTCSLKDILCFVPSDSAILDESSYREAVRTACDAAGTGKHLVVVGIEPTYPATGYGYVETGAAFGEMPDKPVFYVSRFLEKPQLETAAALVSTGRHLWNSGILAGSVEAILESVQKSQPVLFNLLLEASGRQDGQDPCPDLTKAYEAIDSISFDKGVLEKISNILMVKGSFEWCDIGSLDALDKALPGDSAGNAAAGPNALLDTHNSVIYSSGSLIAAIGIKDMIIVNTGDVVLVCPKNRSQEVKVLVELLKEKGFEHLS